MNDSDFRSVSLPLAFDAADTTTPDETPAERLQRRGATALTDAELLSLFIAGPSANALLAARSALDACGGLAALSVADQANGYDAGGLTVRTATLLRAAHELVRRRTFAAMAERDALSSPDDVRRYFALHLAGLPHELFAALFLDNRHRVIEYRELFRGTIDSAAVYPREVVKACLSVNAAAVIFAHNHPSGVAEPSDTDVRLTRKLVDALALIDVRVLDHLVLGQGVQTSLAERGLM